MKATKIVLALMTLFPGIMRASNEEQQIVAAVSGIFAALSTEDSAKLDSLTSQDLYVFDGGTRFTTDARMSMIKAQHAAGREPW